MRVALATLGCKVNQYDSAVIDRLVGEKGWSRVDFSQQADAYVVNSCTVTDRADGDARRLARRARRTNPAARVIMTGCYAQVSPASVAELDYVDYVIGLERLEDLLRALEGELETTTCVSDLRRSTGIATLGISTFPGRTRAFVKVQEGCDLFCTFCIVPVARGPSRSVGVGAVLEEIDKLAASGFREVVLTGVHLGGYGADLVPVCDLASLLARIADAKPRLRIRISSVDPPELSERLLDVVADGSVFCPHFHVPVQSGSDTVLARMMRRYTSDEAADALARLRRRLPDVCIGTDLVTGFPAESEQEFEETLAFVRRAGISYLHVFPYSQRTSTSAAKRWQPLPDAVVHDRARQLRQLDGELRSAYHRRFVGRTVEVLFEHERDATSGRLKGYSQHYLPVHCDGGDDRIGNIVAVRIGSADGRHLRGEFAATRVAAPRGITLVEAGA
ncbi:MAG: tRNA (N(6)-L-threonylcarbamoyladenosine(37)-C(2))-methylthiotransferase MtaB [Deltaproteobacteria bacterium]|nr:tRNA (N(6)-L-threonylcarbamoyladenosine(37)-C(2))-methylthiotransferase MtaB [Deltaproteobacteria bacterium]